jgi:hypothetical protein
MPLTVSPPGPGNWAGRFGQPGSGEAAARVPAVPAVVAPDAGHLGLDLAWLVVCLALRLDVALLVDEQAVAVLGVLEVRLVQDQFG